MVSPGGSGEEGSSISLESSEAVSDDSNYINLGLSRS